MYIMPPAYLDIMKLSVVQLVCLHKVSKKKNPISTRKNNEEDQSNKDPAKRSGLVKEEASNYTKINNSCFLISEERK